MAVSLAAAQNPAILQVRVTEGEGAAYPIGSRATRGVTVQVTDETGRPVEGAILSFRLPEDGPGGAFHSGAKTEIATTKADGRAGVWGMQWNRTAGAFEIRITAVKEQARAGTTVSLHLIDTPHDKLRASSGGNHKWVWIAVAVAGAAVGGVAALAGKSTPAAAATVVASSIQIGTPTIILGRP